MIFLRRDMRNSRKNSFFYHEHSQDEIYDRYKKNIYAIPPLPYPYNETTFLRIPADVLLDTYGQCEIDIIRVGSLPERLENRNITKVYFISCDTSICIS